MNAPVDKFYESCPLNKLKPGNEISTVKLKVQENFKQTYDLNEN